MPRVDMHIHMDAKTQYKKTVEVMDHWGGTVTIAIAGLFRVKDNDGNSTNSASARKIPVYDMAYV
jgi:hypothetical protein